MPKPFPNRVSPPQGMLRVRLMASRRIMLLRKSIFSASTVASLILSLESVISLLAGWILLDQTLIAREICGCVLVFVAIILVQLPEKKKI